ncbi:hypothetical protein EVAR_24215_1 [Eumeta japonica]|uniref:Uncharacterized protein n=1 Tax=Eumeta variegata TaxID=151549 RepID=A0A4C1W654_EUMVA|nr:hypothetical protein EVAR_24215_1 [Eumeta japonica]
MAVNVSKATALLTDSQRNMPTQHADSIAPERSGGELERMRPVSGLHIEYSLRMEPEGRTLGGIHQGNEALQATQRTFNRSDEDLYTSLHNLTPQCEQPPRGYQLPRDLLPIPPNEDKVAVKTTKYCGRCGYVGDVGARADVTSLGEGLDVQCPEYALTLNNRFTASRNCRIPPPYILAITMSRGTNCLIYTECVASKCSVKINLCARAKRPVAHGGVVRHDVATEHVFHVQVVPL